MNASNKTLYSIVAGVAVLIAAYSSVFVVDETQYAIDIRLGDPHRVIKEAGLYFKIPFITDIQIIDNRLITSDSPTGTIITRDKKSMLVDNYAKWRVTDPLKFYQSLRTVEQAQFRLEDIIYSQLRESLGKAKLEEIVSDQRANLMVQVTDGTRGEALQFGVYVQDVRIKRADLPPQNSKAVYGRMEAERSRKAKRYRSEGEEKALEIRSGADRDKVALISFAQQQGEIIRGKADAEATAIYAAAYNADPEFYAFVRSQEAYRKTLGSGTTLVFTREEKGFLRYFR